MSHAPKQPSTCEPTTQSSRSSADTVGSDGSSTANAKAPQKYKTRPVKYVIGPHGSVITVADLPPPRATRWVLRRKAEVVLAVRGGLLSLDEACNRYRLTPEEFFSWQDVIERHGWLDPLAQRRSLPGTNPAESKTLGPFRERAWMSARR